LTVDSKHNEEFKFDLYANDAMHYPKVKKDNINRKSNCGNHYHHYYQNNLLLLLGRMSESAQKFLLLVVLE
jgi:hypothetical protein